MTSMEYLIACSALSECVRSNERRYLLSCDNKGLLLYDCRESCYISEQYWNYDRIEGLKALHREEGVELIKLPDSWLGYRMHQIISDKADTRYDVPSYTVTGISCYWQGIHDGILGYVVCGNLTVYGLLKPSGGMYSVHAVLVKFEDDWYVLKSKSRPLYRILFKLISWESELTWRFSADYGIVKELSRYLKDTGEEIKDVLDLDIVSVRFGVKPNGDDVSVSLSKELDKSELKRYLSIGRPDTLKRYIVYYCYCKYVLPTKSESNIGNNEVGEVVNREDVIDVNVNSEINKEVREIVEAESNVSEEDALRQNIVKYLSINKIRSYSATADAVISLIQASGHKDIFSDLLKAVSMTLSEEKK